MKQRLLTFIAALFILLLATNCAGIKPFFQTASVPALTPPGSSHKIQANRYSENYSYVPTSTEEKGMFGKNKGQYKFSVSFPATVKFEF